MVRVFFYGIIISININLEGKVMKYYGKVFRPPSEARSLIIQATLGCSHNACTFCYMYKGEPFIKRDIDEVIRELEEARPYFDWYEKVFIADGDALILDTKDLIKLIDFIHENMPNVRRISSYATAGDINNKPIEELRELYNNGLTMLYIGFETGDDQTLRDIKKGLTKEDYIRSMEKCREVGFETSVTLIAGLGGRERWRENAIETADLISKTKPSYVSYLTMHLDPEAPLYRDYKEGRFELLEAPEILMEIRLFLENVDSEGSVFRSNHISNYVLLAGVFNRDNKRMIAEIDQALKHEDFRDYFFRRV